jgi:CRP-like cAMP-binding protein
MDAMTERLSRLSLFADLPTPRLESIANSYVEEMFGSGQRILRKGMTGQSLYIILDGEAEFILDGVEPIVLGRGEFFGEVSALLGEPPTADIVARSDLRCLTIPGPELRSFLVANPEVTYRMLRDEAGRLAMALGWRR